MPQLRLECSDNLGDFDYALVFEQLHRVLTSITDISSCKSALLRREDYYLADGDTHRAFIYLKIGMMAGRSDEVKNRVGEQCLSIIQGFFSPILEQKGLIGIPTVEIYDFQHYFSA